MPKTIVIDEMHLTVRIPADLPDPAAVAIHRILNDATFLARLRRAIRSEFREVPELVPCRVVLSR